MTHIKLGRSTETTEKEAAKAEENMTSVYFKPKNLLEALL